MVSWYLIWNNVGFWRFILLYYDYYNKCFYYYHLLLFNQFWVYQNSGISSFLKLISCKFLYFLWDFPHNTCTMCTLRFHDICDCVCSFNVSHAVLSKLLLLVRLVAWIYKIIQGVILMEFLGKITIIKFVLRFAVEVWTIEGERTMAHVLDKRWSDPSWAPSKQLSLCSFCCFFLLN